MQSGYTRQKHKAQRAPLQPVTGDAGAAAATGNSVAVAISTASSSRDASKGAAAAATGYSAAASKAGSSPATAVATGGHLQPGSHDLPIAGHGRAVVSLASSWGRWRSHLYLRRHWLGVRGRQCQCLQQWGRKFFLLDAELQLEH